VPPINDDRVVRLALDVNVFIADILSRRQRRRNTATIRIVDAVRNGICQAGPVQLITSVPIIETFANVLQRRLGYDAHMAEERAWILEEYTRQGPMQSLPHVTVGAGYIPFATEAEMRQSIESHLKRKDIDKLFHEIQDDRYVLETAIAGNADILVTSNIDDFCRDPAIKLQRADVVLYPFANRTLVIATPQFTSYWLDQGIIPDAEFIAEHPDDFAQYAPPSKKPGET
jgi:predicted nucleic acid-binding protein